MIHSRVRCRYAGCAGKCVTDHPLEPFGLFTPPNTEPRTEHHQHGDAGHGDSRRGGHDADPIA